MKITEKALLEGYDGMSNDGITAQSLIDNVRVWWTYRKGDTGDGYNVVTEDRDEAAEITLSNDRVGTIDLDDDLTPELIAVAEKHAENCRKTWGDSV